MQDIDKIREQRREDLQILENLLTSGRLVNSEEKVTCIVEYLIAKYSQPLFENVLLKMYDHLSSGISHFSELVPCELLSDCVKDIMKTDSAIGYTFPLLQGGQATLEFLASHIAFIPPRKKSIRVCDKRIQILNDVIAGRETVNCSYTDTVLEATKYLREKHTHMGKNELLKMAKKKLQKTRSYLEKKMTTSSAHNQQSTAEVGLEEIAEEEQGDDTPNSHSKRVADNSEEEIPSGKKRRLNSDEEDDFDPKDVRKKDGRGRKKKRLSKK